MDTARWKRLRTVFEGGVSLPEAERGRYLEEACGADEALRRDVEKLFAADAVEESLEPPVVAEFQSPTSSSFINIGRRIGRYELEHVVGRGGIATVYLARCLDGEPEQRVALKLIRRGMATGDILRRFKNERQVLADLDHPGIARLIDGGATEDGFPYLVMEHVQGEPLDRYCDGRRLTIRERVAIFRKICEAVHFAHENRVVHRDLKPTNILVNAEGAPKLLDFGIAKILDDAGSMKTTDITATELRLMTPEYASPEQVRGRKVSRATDVYSLGVNLYELLTGHRPHGETVRQRSELERRICEEDPTRPSQAVRRPVDREVWPSALRGSTTKRVRADLRGDLDTICLMALRKEPGRRYATAAGLADDLARWLDGRPVLARRESWPRLTLKFVRRNKVLVGAATAVLLSLTLGLFASLGLYSEAETQRLAAEEREYRAQITAASLSLRARDVAAARAYLDQAPQELRGWEWRHFSARTDKSEQILTGHGDSLRQIVWSPDGRMLASAAEDGTVRIWTPDTGADAFVWEGHSTFVVSLAFGPAGRTLAAASEHAAVRLLDVESRRELWTASLPAREVVQHPDGSRVAVGCTDGTIRVLAADTGRVQMTLEGHPASVLELGFRREGDELFSMSGDGTVRIWDLVTHASRTVRNEGESCLAPDPHGKRGAAGGEDGRVAVFDVASGNVLLEWPAHEQSIRDIAFDPSGERVATASADRTVKIWDAATGVEEGVLLGHASGVACLAFSPDGEWIATGGVDGTARVWRADTDDVPVLRGDAGWVMDLAVSPDGLLLATGAWEDSIRSSRGGICVWDLRERSEVWRALDGLAPTNNSRAANGLGLGWSLDGRRIVSVFRDGVRSWNAKTREMHWTPSAGDLRVVAPAIDPRGGRVAIAGERISFASLETGEPLSSLPEPATSVAFSPDGSRLVSTRPEAPDVEAAVQFWELAVDEDEPRMSIPTSGQRAWGCAYRPDGLQVAAACADGVIRLWRTSDGSLDAVLRGHTATVFRVSYSPDGTRLASASADTTVKLWDHERGIEMATLHGHTAPVLAVTFGPDGLTLYSQDRSGEVRIWEAPPNDSDF